MKTENKKLALELHTSLEKSNDVLDTLHWKLENIKAENRPIEESLADYFALTIENLERSRDYLKDVMADIRTREKEIASQIERIKTDGATFLLENGLERLDGQFCSSVTITKGKPEETSTVSKEEFRLLITQEEMEDLLIGLGKAEIVEVKRDKVSVAIPAKIRVNQRKIKIPEVIEKEE